MIKFLILFILTFIIVFIIYQLLFIKYNKKDKKEKNKYPMEVMILKNYYKVDVENINMKKLLSIISIASSLDIAIIISILGLFKSGIVQIIIAMIIVVPLILLSYYLISLGYKRNQKK